MALDVPDDEDLRALVAKFEAGDYRAVRDGVARIAASNDKSDVVKAAARALRARTEPSREQIILLAVTALLVVAISAWAILTHGPHGHPAGPAPRPTIERIH